MESKGSLERDQTLVSGAPDASGQLTVVRGWQSLDRTLGAQRNWKRKLWGSHSYFIGTNCPSSSLNQSLRLYVPGYLTTQKIAQRGQGTPSTPIRLYEKPNLDGYLAYLKDKAQQYVLRNQLYSVYFLVELENPHAKLVGTLIYNPTSWTIQ